MELLAQSPPSCHVLGARRHVPCASAALSGAAVCHVVSPSPLSATSHAQSSLSEPNVYLSVCQPCLSDRLSHVCELPLLKAYVTLLYNVCIESADFERAKSSSRIFRDCTLHTQSFTHKGRFTPHSIGSRPLALSEACYKHSATHTLGTVQQP